ncbi:MAG: biotin transporter BioY [Phycisphaerae bacterium]
MKTLCDYCYPPRATGRVVGRDLSLVFAGGVLVAVCAKIQIPAFPVPLTLQTFAVLLAGAALGARRGAAAMATYLVAGAAGLPVFAGPVAGPAYLAGPTAGFLLAFPVAAFVVGGLTERGWDRRVLTAALALTVGNGIILGVGFAWLAVQLGQTAAWASVFSKSLLLWDAMKIALAACALPAAWSVVRRLDGPR